MADLDALAGRILAPRNRALGDHVVEQLRELIITGGISDGTHLVESQLSTTFGVSRGPIRDALVQLEQEGLVESRRRGAFARGLTSRDVDELYSVREAIEVMAFRLAAKAPEPDWAAVERPLEAMRAAAAEGAHLAFARADREFHSCFYQVAGNARLEKIWRQYEPTFAVLLELTTAEDVDLGPSFDSHDELLTLMRSNQLETAIDRLQIHLLGSRSRLLTAVNRIGHGEDVDDARERS